MISYRRFFGALAIGFALWQAPAQAAPISAADRAEVEQAEQYLNAVTTLKARFIQVAPSGDTTEGTVFLSRPGKLRLDYDPPTPILVVADGSFLIYYDKQLKQVSYLDLDSSPAGVLVRPQVQLDGGDLQVTKVGHAPDVLNVTVMHRGDASQGHITLVFTEHPFALRQWRVLDPQGQTTTVSLFSPEIGLPLDKGLFRFKDPTIGDGSPDLSTRGK